MGTVFIIVVILALGTAAYRAFRRTGAEHQRQRSLRWGWALAGAIAGSFMGVVAFGGAIAATLPGAAFGWVLGKALGRAVQQPTPQVLSTAATPAETAVRPAAAFQQVDYTEFERPAFKRRGTRAAK